jgi:small GTP-binding protein
MIQKKVCLLGAFAVGKTSLVSRFVHGIFSDRYLTTIGVKIDRKVIPLEDTQLHLLLWDLHGEDDFQTVRPSYLRGAAGYVLVADGTRRNTLDIARRLRDRALSVEKSAEYCLLINKADLVTEWEVPEESLAALAAEGWDVRRVSAKTGEGVEEGLVGLASRLVPPR